MEWKKHYTKTEHSFLSPSSYHWLNYDHEKLAKTYINVMYAKQKGTKIHELASGLIEEQINLPETNETLNLYVNESIKKGMDTEKLLYYSENCFGRADAIKYDEDKKELIIHDLKTGTIKASLNQLKIYAALFCLDYEISPYELNKIELTIFQNDDYISEEAEQEEIDDIAMKIIDFDDYINKLKEELH